MEAAVDVLKERLDKMDTTDLEANPDEIESKSKHQKFLRKWPRWKLSEHWKTDMGTSI
jgi:hypothetical protein